jgi:hypothetical protein
VRPVSARSDSFSEMPRLSFRTRGNERYEAFENLTPEIVAIESGIVWLRCCSDSRLLAVGIGLDFVCECIDFNLKTGVMPSDDGSATAVRYALDDNRFYRDMVTNGELEIWDSDNEELVGRADPLLPVNVDIGRTVEALDERHRQLEATLASRIDSSRDSTP